MSREIRNKILTILAEHEHRSMRYTWDEDLWDAVDIPWSRFNDQLAILEWHDMIITSEPGRPKYGRDVRITDLGLKRLEQSRHSSKSNNS